MKVFTVAILLLCASYGYGQSSYTINVTPANGHYNLIDNLRGVQGILSGDVAYDSHNHRFIYISVNADGLWHISTADAATGATLSSTSFFYASGALDDNINEIQYDNSAETLYGIDYVSSEKRNYLASIDFINGTITRLDSIPDMRRINPGSSAYDQINHRFIFIGGSRELQWRLYSVYTGDGSLVSDTLFPEAGGAFDMIGQFQNDSTNTLYGIDQFPSGSDINIVRVDASSGAFTSVTTLHNIKTINPSSVTFDHGTHTYIFSAQDTLNNWSMYFVHVQSGNTQVFALYPWLTGLAGRVTALYYDSSASQLYGIDQDSTDLIIGVHEPALPSYQLSAYPDPFSDQATIQLNGTYQSITAVITNSLGQILRKEDFHSTSSVIMQRGSLPEGLYFVSLIADGKQIGAVKLGVK